MSRKKANGNPGVGLRIQQYRTEHVLSQEEFGILVKLTGRRISQIETGKAVVPPRTEHRIDKILNAPPPGPLTKSAALLSDHQIEDIEKIRSMVVGSSEVYQALGNLPNGTQFFSVRYLDVRESSLPGPTFDLLEILRRNPNSQWYFLHPKSPVFRSGSSTGTFASQGQRVEKDLFRDVLSHSQFDSRLAAPGRKAAYLKSLDRVHTKPLSLDHYFHPIVRTIVAIPPTEASDRSHKGGVLGWLEIPFYYSNALPAMIRLSIPEVNDVMMWLSNADAFKNIHLPPDSTTDEASQVNV